VRETHQQDIAGPVLVRFTHPTRKAAGEAQGAKCRSSPAWHPPGGLVRAPGGGVRFQFTRGPASTKGDDPEIKRSRRGSGRDTCEMSVLL
jgi:hypothetical protein